MYLPYQANHNRQILNTLSHVHPMQHSTCNIFAGNKHVTLYLGNYSA